MQATWWRWLVGATLAVTGAAAGQAADPQGYWQVSEPPELAGQSRRVARDGERQVVVQLEWPDGVRVTARGGSPAGGLMLDARSGGPGIVQVLAGEEYAPTRYLQVSGQPLAPLTPGGPARLHVRLIEDGRVVRTEVWARAPERSFELRSLTPSAGFDPKRIGPLRATLRINRAPLRLQVSVLLPLAGRGDPRQAFYTPQLPREQGALVVRRWTEDVAAAGPDLERVLVFDGRDGTPARRLLLGGEYVLRVEALALPGEVEERAFAVVSPHAETVMPRWLQRPAVDVVTKAAFQDPGEDLRRRAAPAVDALRSLGYRPHVHVSTIDTQRLVDALTGSAQVTVCTHGNSSGLAFYRIHGADPALTESPVPLENPARVFTVRADDLERALQGDASLRDLHAAFLWACSTGADGETDGSTPEPGAGSGLPSWLLRKGCDLVVAFNRLVFRGQLDSWLPRLLANLSGEGDAAPTTGVRSLSWAAREAASYSDAFWVRFTPEQQANAREGGVTPLSESIRVLGGPGIDPERETLYPPRYGNSTN